MKILPVKTDLFQADGRTDITKVTVALRNYTNTPKTHKCPYGGKMNSSEFNLAVHVVPAISEESRYIIGGPKNFNERDVRFSRSRI